MDYFFILALAGLALAGLFGFPAWQHRSKVRGFAETEQMTTGTLRQLVDTAAEAAGPGAFSQLVEVRGEAGPGPEGALSSPVSDTDCVWFAHEVECEYETVDRDKEGRTQRRKRTEKVERSQCDKRIRITDSQGHVLLAPGKTFIHGVEKVTDQYRPAEGGSGSSLELGGLKLKLPGGNRGGTLGCRYREWVVRPGAMLYVQGQARDDDSGDTVTITDPPDRDLIISTEAEEQLVAEEKGGFMKSAAIASAGGLGAIVCAVIGLVRVLG